MSNDDLEINNHNINSESNDTKKISPMNDPELMNQSTSFEASPKWINNRGEEVKQVFGFNENDELVNARLAMVGFLMLIITEIVFSGEPATQKIFGIN